MRARKVSTVAGEAQEVKKKVWKSRGSKWRRRKKVKMKGGMGIIKERVNIWAQRRQEGVKALAAEPTN